MVNRNLIQGVVTSEQKTAMDNLAKALGTTASGLGRVLFAKALNTETFVHHTVDAARARELVALGLCSDEAEALKLVKAMRGEWS